MEAIPLAAACYNSDTADKPREASGPIQTVFIMGTLYKTAEQTAKEPSVKKIILGLVMGAMLLASGLVLTGCGDRDQPQTEAVGCGCN